MQLTTARVCGKNQNRLIFSTENARYAVTGDSSYLCRGEKPQPHDLAASSDHSITEPIHTELIKDFTLYSNSLTLN